MSGLLKINKLKISLLFTFLILSITWIVIGNISFPNDDEYILNNFIFGLNYFFNNTGQTLQYISLLIGFVIIFPIVFCLIRKKNQCRIIDKIFDILIYLLIVFSLVISIKNILGVVLILLITPVIYFYYNHRISLGFKIKHQNLLIAFIIVYTSILYINTSFQQSSNLMHHVTAYYYPIHKILNGLTPYIDFNPLYGGYSYVYALILNFFPHQRLLVFSIITTLLVFLSLFLTYKFLKVFLKNNMKVLIAFFSFLLCNIYFGYAYDHYTYIQYMPHRYLSFVIMLNYVLYYLKNPTIKKYILGFLLCSLSIFWSTDSGMITTISYTLFIIYYQICDKRFINIFFTILLSIISVVVSLFFIEFIIYIRVGYFADIKNIIFSTIFFSNYGFLSIKLNYFEFPWIIVIIGYLIFLGISISNLFKKKDKDIGIVFFLSILGLGIFSYFVQRAVLIKYLFSIVPLIFLLSSVEIKRIKVFSYTLNSVLSLLCLIFIFTSFNYKFMSSNVDSTLKEQDRILSIFSEDVGKENFEMYINCDTIYYELLNKNDIKRIPSYLDLFTKEDLSKLIKYIENSDKNMVVSYELVASQYEKFLTDKIKKKYYIYYIFNKNNFDNYVFFIKKKDINKISNIDEFNDFNYIVEGLNE